MDLSLPRNKLPGLKGKSRKEILDLLANRVGPEHDALIEALNRNDIKHTVCSFTKNVFVKDCDWNTLFKISNLANQLNCHLTVSGGGAGEYYMDPPIKCKFSLELLETTADYQKLIATGYSTDKPLRSVKVGVIDSGCSHFLFSELAREQKVVMHNAMFNTVNPKKGDYQDCYSRPDQTEGHGTGVVEIIANCVVPNTRIYVANIGDPFDESNVISAMMAQFELGVEIINCSFGVKSTSM